jgi:alanine racemase
MNANNDDDRVGTRLIVDLGAIRRNYRTLVDRVADTVTVAAVVKADAYGLGADRVAPVLAAEGCADFFVATGDEAISLRAALPEVRIYALNGNIAGSEPELAANGLVPVLNDLGALERWQAQARLAETPLRAVIHVDTGMSRLGLSPAECARLEAEPGRLDGLTPSLLISHLACAEEPEHPLNEGQRADFIACARRLPPMDMSLANSPGFFLGPRFHFDMVRAGAALYGINPTPSQPNPMAEVARLQGKIVALRDVDSPMTVGYGATHRVTHKGRIATIPIGYADGFPRALGNHAIGVLADRDKSDVSLPVVGRVSMDLITLDVSDLPPDQTAIGTYVDLFGGRRTVDDVAADAGTIGYELLVRIGRRIPRVYRNSEIETADQDGADRG